MLLVATYLARSTIEGIGCFARHDIANGTPVWRFEPGFDVLLTHDLVDQVCDREFIARYTQRARLTSALLLPSDNARFINHADEPNLRSLGDGWPELWAGRDIGAGEELTCDYRIGDPDPWAGFGERQLNILRSLRFSAIDDRTP